jgi:uncharacterized repeat protein (TIGR02543 family)
MNHEKRARNKGIKATWMVLCLTALAVSCLIYACFEPIGMETSNSTFSITIGGGGRTILSWATDGTDSADLLHTITLTGGSGPDVIREGVRQGQTVQFTVAPGHWDITVKAYLGDVLKAEGFASVNLKRGHNGAVPINMGKPAASTEPPTVNAEKPTITGQPTETITIHTGGEVSLSITASVSDDGEISYQWYSNTSNSNFGGTSLGTASDANTANYKLPTSEMGTFYYYCVVTNTITDINGGTKTATETSIVVTVTVNNLINALEPTISEQPTAITTINIGGVVSLSITAFSDDGNISYQWYSNTNDSNYGGTSLGTASDANTPNYKLPTTSWGIFYYYCVVTNTIYDNGDGGAKIATLASNVATVTVYCTVTFDRNGGTTDANPMTKTVTYPATTVGTLPTAPTKTGYTFASWNTKTDGSGTGFTANTLVTGDITVYAVWTINSYTVTFNRNGGTTDASPTSKSTVYNTTVGTLPTAPTRTGYTFASWNTKTDGSGTGFTANTLVVADITVYAQWTINRYTVTFDKNGGDTEANPPTMTVDYNTSVTTLPTPPTRSDYYFVSWTPASDGSGTVFTASTPVTANRTVYAKWVPLLFNVANSNDWNNAIDAIKGGGNGKSYTINVTSDFSTGSTSFGNDVTGLSVTITGNQTITLSVAGPLLSIYANQTVIICDIRLKGNNNTGNGVLISVAGNLTMEGNSSVFDNKNSSAQSNRDKGAGGVYVGSGGTFTMEGGTISGNEGLAGGVYVDNGGTFIMKGGIISGNKAASSGGGVNNRGTFYIVTGIIYGSSVPGNTILQNKASIGDAFYTSGIAERGTFTENGWNKKDDIGGPLTGPDKIEGSSNTIKVENGEIVP